MKQINKIAKELKKNLAGTYNNYYKSATIYLDTENDELYLKLWGQGESWINKPKALISIASYKSQYGDWGEQYGDKQNWSLTKKAIATDIKSNIADKVNIPQWLIDEVEYYTAK